MLFRRATKSRPLRDWCFNAKVAATFFLFACTPPYSTFALDFTSRQIADPLLENRDPTISENGSVYWIAYDTNDTSSAITDLVRYQRGERVSMGVDRAIDFMANAKPTAQSNYVVWIADYRKFTPTSWILAQVPPKEGDPSEIPSQYKAFQDPVTKRQWLENLADSTNIILVTVTNNGIITTNFISEAYDVTNSSRHPSGIAEINLWTGTGEVVRVTTDTRNDFAPSVWGGLVSWQKARGWPFGWEIMMWETGQTWQITTNYYYDMAPVVQNRQMVWYGWDGYDFEIYLYDGDKNETIQITSNRFDDVGPVLWDGVIAWEGYPSVEADIFMWKNGQTTKLSDSVEDDVSPRIWNGQVVWQSFDGDDFEIYLYDGMKTVKLTQNNYDDVSPDIHDGVIAWMGYEGGWDAEIYAWDGAKIQRLTENEGEDRDPKTRGQRIVWFGENDGRNEIWLAEPQ